MNDRKDIDTKIFREYDIRGKYPEQLNEDVVYEIGQAYGTYIRENGEKECVVGRDNRMSGEALTNSFIEGLLSTGVDVIFVGIVTTPILNYASIYLKKKYSVEITASHNPKDDNGIKMFEDACHIIGDRLKSIYETIEKKDYRIDDKGKMDFVLIEEAYVKYMLDSVDLQNKNLRVVVDPGNGTASVVVKEIFDELGVDVVYINELSKGNFPNHHPDPNVEENLEQLKRIVKEVGADVGIALDGDCDRIGIVDENGNYVETDELMAIFAKDIIDKSPYKEFLIDIKCSKLLEDEIKRLGGNSITVRNGSAYIENELRNRDVKFGGEYSGHIFFRDRHYGFDDGLYAGLRLLEILANTGRKVSELISHLNKYYNTPEIRIETRDEIKFKIVDEIKKYCDESQYEYITIDGVKVIYEDGWVLVRASNTGPNLTTRFEANDENRLEELQNEFMALIEKLNR